jgi:hypothetical protein
LNATAVTATLVAIAVVLEVLFPGRAFYHAGWFNVALAALAVATIEFGRRSLQQTNDLRGRVGIAAVLLGAATLGLAGVASGLFAPDNQTFVGAPGARVRVEALGVLVFPIASNASADDVTVTLERRTGGTLEIGARSRDAGNFIVRAVPRTVVYVEASDLRGDALTVTQPTGSAFLSPVLLMEHRQNIAGMDLPFDSFNVPAARRVVKAVMFSADQAAMLLHGGAELGAPAVLFAVDDEHERPVPHSIALSAAGAPVTAGDLRLRGIVGSYPGVEVVAAPNIFAVVVGWLLVLGGFAFSLAIKRKAH